MGIALKSISLEKKHVPHGSTCVHTYDTNFLPESFAYGAHHVASIVALLPESLMIVHHSYIA